MEVLLLKDIPNLGLAGQVKKVTIGYARNFLFPNSLAKKASAHEVERFNKVLDRSKHDSEIVGSRLAAIATQIRNMHFSISKKVHDNNKLYGAISADEIVDMLKEKNIKINKKQVEFSKAIKTTGEHTVIIKLSSKAKPEFVVKVVAAKE